MTILARLLRTLGIRAHALSELKPTYDPALAAEGRYIFVHNDSVSRMDTVAKWLGLSFGMERKDALVVMLTVHHHGYAVLGPYERSEAAALVTTAQKRAAELGLTELRFSITPP